MLEDAALEGAAGWLINTIDPTTVVGTAGAKFLATGAIGNVAVATCSEDTTHRIAFGLGQVTAVAVAEGILNAARAGGSTYGRVGAVRAVALVDAIAEATRIGGRSLEASVGGAAGAGHDSDAASTGRAGLSREEVANAVGLRYAV